MKPICYGDNKTLKKIRNGFPEPHDYPCNYIKGIVPQKHMCSFIDVYLQDNPIIELSGHTVTFEKKRIVEPGMSYYAWVSELDGCIYF